MPRYKVESRYQDGGWEHISSWAAEQDACDIANRASFDAISYGMVRVVDTQTGAILREYGAGAKGKYTVPTVVGPVKAAERRINLSNTFYTVFCNRHLPDAVMQQTYESENLAKVAAERLVGKYPEDTFYIMRVVGKVEAQKVVYTEFPKEGPVYRHETSVGWPRPTVSKEFS